MSIFDVGFEVSGLRKRLGANVALERSQTTMGVRVALELGRSYEALATIFAFVAQPIVRVPAATPEDIASTAAAATAATTQEVFATSKYLNTFYLKKLFFLSKTKTLTGLQKT